MTIHNELLSATTDAWKPPPGIAESVVRFASHFQHRQESFLRNVHAPHPLHALLAFLLLFEEFPFAADVSAIALGNHVFAYRADRIARNHSAANRRLQRHFEHL